MKTQATLAVVLSVLLVSCTSNQPADGLRDGAQGSPRISMAACAKRIANSLKSSNGATQGVADCELEDGRALVFRVVWEEPSAALAEARFENEKKISEVNGSMFRDKRLQEIAAEIPEVDLKDENAIVMSLKNGQVYSIPINDQPKEASEVSMVFSSGDKAISGNRWSRQLEISSRALWGNRGVNFGLVGEYVSAQSADRQLHELRGFVQSVVGAKK